MPRFKKTGRRTVGLFCLTFVAALGGAPTGWAPTGWAPTVWAQRGGGPGSPGSARLERSGLRIGSPLPSVTAYDEQGRDLPIGQLKGDYTVLVFGCLT